MPQRDAFQILDAWSWPDTVVRESRTRTAAPAAHALDGGMLGPFPAESFRLATGDCERCTSPDAALWWFRDEVIAVPDVAAGDPAARDAAAVQEAAVETAAARDLPVAAGAEAAADGPETLPLPRLVWIGAPEILEHARLSDDARDLEIGGAVVPFAVTPRIATNRDYVDASTAKFFGGRTLRIRGAFGREGRESIFVGRTIWPEDVRLDLGALESEPLLGRETLGTLIEAQSEPSEGGFSSRLLFVRDAHGSDSKRRWAGKSAIAFVLTGAQSDDDGSKSGHLAAGTGVIGPQGQWSDWLVNNFYPLEEASAKGILPATLPMDNYLFDLNSGQLYYRPGYMLVAVLRRPDAAAAVQRALQREMLELHCGDVEFHLARRNSTAMTIDPLRALGWRIPGIGPTSRLAGIVAAPLVALFNRDFAAGRDIFAALTTERTRLLPRLAFEVAGHDLLSLANGPASGTQDLTPFERTLADDVEAVVFVRLPQVPSSRRFGTFPVRSLLAYGARLLADPNEFESAPDGGTRELPESAAGTC